MPVLFQAIKRLCGRNWNFFTAKYVLILKQTVYLSCQVGRLMTTKL